MLRRAYRVLYLVGSGDAWVRNGIRNWRCLSDSFKGVKGCTGTKPEHVTQLYAGASKKARVMALAARIRSLQAKAKDLEARAPTEKSKIVRAKLVLILKDLAEALRELRRRM